MIRLNDELWIGGSVDEERANLYTLGIAGVLNVAQDLQPKRGWRDKLEYMHVGLVDGPGNPLVVYSAAVLALAGLIERQKRVLVCCYEGGRSLAVVLMYMHLMNPLGWDGWLESIRERLNVALPIPHAVHREAFDKLNWQLLNKLTEKE